MTEGKPYLSRSGADERLVVEEMLRDPLSGYWDESYEFVRWRVQVQADNVPKDHWEDIVQDAMIRFRRSLLTFQYHCALRTWLFNIVRTCVIDFRRRYKRAGQLMAPLSDFHEDAEHEVDMLIAASTRTVEDECIIHDDIAEALAALEEYVSTHTNSTRNRHILNMVLFEERSLEEAAETVGCSAAVAGYIVRSARRYVRERLKDQ